MSTIECIGCAGRFPDISGPVHRYMDASPGCWAAFGEVLAREYGDPEYFEVHRMTVDAYAVQHPGTRSPQSIRSVGVHLIRLCLFIKQGLSAERANAAMLNAAKHKGSFAWLVPPSSLGALIVAEVVRAETPVEHKRLVRAWAQAAWAAWAPHHETVKAWMAAR